MDRILIELTGSLPEDNKFATLATAQSLAVAMAEELKEKHKLDLTVSVRPIKESAPRAKKVATTEAIGSQVGAPIVTAIPLVAEVNPIANTEQPVEAATENVTVAIHGHRRGAGG